MKKIRGLVLAFMLLHTIAFSQDDYVQNPTFGVHFIFNDFKTAEVIRNTSLGAALRNKQFGKIKDMSPGLALNYIQGLSPSFDFTSTLTGSFLDYKFKDGTTAGKDNLLLELDASIRGKMFPNKYVVSPYLQIGVGGSTYKGYWGAFIPTGMGLQVNIFDEAYLLINAQYRIGITSTTSNHFMYGIGLAGVIGKRKAAAKPVALPPPLPPPPDSDGDGIVDNLDECPQQKGLPQFNGCPDTDGDGIPDNKDSCPLQAGLERYKGCPIPDTDGDGINDEEDKCPQERGVARYQGCPIPDRDKDGVNDEEDKCPDLPGPASNHGCPEIKEEVKQRIDVAAHNIFFATGSATLLAKSHTSLDEVAHLMKEDPNLRLDIEGHTDNTGKPASNQLLSEKRAKSVYDYLNKKGVAADRLRSAGFGQDQPIADNKTVKGRNANRRVALKLHYD